jgi:prepilin-type N-terminal cleavage/methylation domain-containing protein
MVETIVVRRSRSGGLRRRMRRGFSLVELGIVIAVIAVLAAVVIFGRGFIQSARVTKAVDACNTVRKAGSTFAGVQGGVVRGAGNRIQALVDRGLLPALGAGGAWVVSGDGDAANSILINEIEFGQLNRGTAQSNAVRVRVTFPSAIMASDFIEAIRNDTNYVAAGGTIGQACTVLAPGGTAGSGTVEACFFL